MKPAPALPLHDATLWPLLMTKEEVAAAIRKSTRTLERMVDAGLFPEPTAAGEWVRQDVIDYVEGKVRQFDRQRQGSGLRIVGGQR